MNIAAYQIIESNGSDVQGKQSFEDKINELIYLGWTPLGGVVMNFGNYCQAMGRESE